MSASAADLLVLERVIDAARHGDAHAAEVLERARAWETPNAAAIVQYVDADAAARRLAAHVAYYLSHAASGRPVPMGPATVAALARAQSEGGR